MATNLKEQLEKCGFKVIDAGSGAHILEFGLEDDRESFWVCDDSDMEPPTVKVNYDADFRQAVVNITEQERTLLDTRSMRKYKSSTWDNLLKSYAPNGTEATAVRILHKTFSMDSTDGSRFWCVEFELTLAPSTNSFLVGYDEKALFISILPETVNTVRQAHNILRPSEVPKGSPRHGEFFFVKITDKKKIALLDQRIRLRLDAGSLAGDWDDADTEHFAGVLTDLGEGESFVIGPIFGKERHDRLMLSEWHKVVRNLELADSTFTVGYD